MECRKGCGACCIAPSISQAYYQMPRGKKAGERCVHLNDENLCQIFGRKDRPDFCAAFMADESICGDSYEEALAAISNLELQTKSE